MTKLWFLIFLVPYTASAAAGAGTISGLVKDERDKPLMGAFVSIYDAVTAKQILQVVRTDTEGRYLAKVLPGNYLLKAVAIGYSPGTVASARVVANQTAFFNFTLRRVSTLIGDDVGTYRKVLRRARHVFQFEDDRCSEEIDSKDLTSGNLSVYSTVGYGEGAGLNFALSKAIGSAVQVLIAGQTDVTSYGTSKGIAAKVVSEAASEVTLDVQYVGLPLQEGRAFLARYDVDLTDKWYTDSLTFVYGVQLSKLSAIGYSDMQISPRIEFALDLDGKGQAYAGLSVPKYDAAALAENVEISPLNYAAVRTKRREIGYRRAIADDTEIDVSLFSDNFVAVAPFRQGSRRGMRIIFSRTGKFLTAALGYGFGQQSGLAQAGGNFQVLSTRVDLQMPTGTRLSALVGVGNSEPFLGSFLAVPPGLSVYIRQQLPVNFIPGRWEALLDLRNLVDCGDDVVSYRQPRSLRGGVSVRF
ncbi:MAG: carboxypeptidase-like regulatory domain-containing protein [Acidobacteriota bacterium]|nr:carboxypeptidase-like regulatory domain-containing protein [Blastocatellia bacterium]MDW8411565.1 carboxypeptidase-like regulatory domain-containing protein [Acidobacteriota bacterium]